MWGYTTVIQIITITTYTYAKHCEYIGACRDGEGHQARGEAGQIRVHKRIYAQFDTVLEYPKACGGV